ncbi:hypothetical protein GQ55_3G489600 [Panicum hallii var. hallii]|uniref:Uncharacterized protein n=1 Tax=Panicum hallii var. hallii TaxID=1504633 RepID=A0A2T7EJX1_9POAL|nr:hypothetical protein GQ55_3G489600 [Panicum hallii var. hallii]
MNSGASAIETEYMLYGRLSKHIAIYFDRWCGNPWGSRPSCINRHKLLRRLQYACSYADCQMKRLQLDNSNEASSGDITNTVLSTDVESEGKNVERHQGGCQVK